MAAITPPLQAEPGRHFATTTAEKAIQAAEHQHVQAVSNLSVAKAIATIATQTEDIAKVIGAFTTKSTQIDIVQLDMMPKANMTAASTQTSPTEPAAYAPPLRAEVPKTMTAASTQTSPTEPAAFAPPLRVEVPKTKTGESIEASTEPAPFTPPRDVIEPEDTNTQTVSNCTCLQNTRYTPS